MADPRAASRDTFLTGVSGILQHRDGFVVALMFSAWHRELQKATIEGLAHDYEQETRIVDFLSEQAVQNRARSHSPQRPESRKPCTDPLQTEAKSAHCAAVDVDALGLQGAAQTVLQPDGLLEHPEVQHAKAASAMEALEARSAEMDAHLAVAEAEYRKSLCEASRQVWDFSDCTLKQNIPQPRTESASTCASEQDILQALEAVKINAESKAPDVHAINSNDSGDVSLQEVADAQRLCNEGIRILDARPMAIPASRPLAPDLTPACLHQNACVLEEVALEAVPNSCGGYFGGFISQLKFVAALKDDHCRSSDKSGDEHAEFTACTVYACPMLTNGPVRSEI